MTSPSYKLIGATASPYARRLRLYLNDIPYAWEPIDYLSPQGHARLAAVNPILRLPVLIVDEKPIWETRVIFQYLRGKSGRPPLSIDEENAVSSVDALQDQLIQLFLMQRLGDPLSPGHGYLNRASDRQSLILTQLEQEHAMGRFQAWDYPAMALFCLIDWALFRDRLKVEAIPASLMAFYAACQARPMVINSGPRRG